MKRFVPVVLLATLAIGASFPAEAKTVKKKRYTVHIEKAPVPCHVICAYWMEGTWGAENEELGTEFNACSDPFPTGSYTDIVVRAPNNANLMSVYAYPLLDWDTFVCSKPRRGNNGRILAEGANAIDDTNCDLAMGLGCRESMHVRVREYRYYVIRAYNWSDVDDMPVTVVWKDL